MTILAGILCRNHATRLSDAACDAVRRALSRDPRDGATQFRDDHAFLAKVDINAFEEPAFLVRPDGSVSMLAGEPLLAADGGRRRNEDLERIHEACDSRDWRLLPDARGVFCAAHYDSRTRRLTLIADKLGIRPLYYWVGDDYVAFATALRILEVLGEVPKRMDLRGVTELACFGYPLGDRSPYEGVRVLRAAEVVQVSAEGIVRSQYWRWDAVQPSQRPEPELLDQAHEQFGAAVDRRLRRDTTTTSFLSGGLDSRCVVAALLSRGVRVHTVSFGIPGTQDEVFGAQFARAAGTVHIHAPMQPTTDPHWSMLMTAAIRAAPTPHPRPERPQLVWSGDGGSLGTGHIYQTREMVELLRRGQRDAAVRAFLSEHRTDVARRVLQRSVVESLASLPYEGIREELADLRSVDPGRAIHLFLLLNDQRRHLAAHFEDIDLHRLELELPFFDSDFLQAMLETPIDFCLYHAFYVNWLSRFPSVVAAVPWQTYPGHVPCPVPAPEGLPSQWTDTHVEAVRRPRRRELLRRAIEMLQAERFPDDLLRRGALRLANWVYRAGLRDCGHTIAQASVYHRYWVRAGGRWVAPRLSASP